MSHFRNACSTLNKLFVYGALKYGQPGHSVLSSGTNGYSKFWCQATTAEKYPLVIATRYNIPFMLNKPGSGCYVTGEIYEVDDRILDCLDKLEDCQQIYKRDMTKVNIGVGEGTVDCWMYLLQRYPDKLLSLPYLATYENTPQQPYVLRNRRTHKFPAQEDLSYNAQQQ